MSHRRYPALEQVCAHCGGHWIQQDGKEPRPYCTTTCRQAAEGRSALPSTDAPQGNVPLLATRTRRIQARLVTLTCTWCHRIAEVEQFPGPRPRYCSASCREEALRAGAATRMQRMRQRRQQALVAPQAHPPDS